MMAGCINQANVKFSNMVSAGFFPTGKTCLCFKQLFSVLIVHILSEISSVQEAACTEI